MRPARSVHLWWDIECSPKSLVVNSLVVEASCPGSYFCAIGWSCGYCGLQELEGGRKVIIFSVWDNNPDGGDDPNAIEDWRRVRCTYAGKNVDVARFGNEGTGGRTLTPFSWTLGQRYHFAIHEEVLPGVGTVRYTCWFGGGNSAWTKIASLDCPAVKHRGLHGLYSFCEDFHRNGFEKEHRATFGPCWAMVEGDPNSVFHCHSCLFTAASEKGDNIDARAHESGFTLCSGGQVKQTLALNGRLAPVCALVAVPTLPKDIHEALGGARRRAVIVTDLFSAENPGEIDLLVGEEYELLNEGHNGDGWWEVQNGKKRGFAPGSFFRYK